MRWSRFAALSALFAITLLTPSPAAAANGGAAIYVPPVGYGSPTGVVAMADSGAIVVFTTDTNSLYAQRLDRHGKPLWAAPGLLIKSGLVPQYTYPMLPDGTGGVILGWQENRGVTGEDIVVQRVLPNGTLGYAASGLVLCNAVGSQGEPQLVSAGAGAIYAVWKDERTTGPSNSDVYAQRFTVAGVPSWAANGVRVNSATTINAGPVGGGGRPYVAADLQGGLLATWLVDSSRIPRAQKVSNVGALLWGANGVSFGVAFDNPGPIAPDGSGGLWTVYTHYTSFPNGGPYLQRVLSIGTAAFAGVGVDLAMGLSSSQFNTFEAAPVRNGTNGCMVYGLQFASGGGPFRRQEVNEFGTLLRGSGETLLNQVSSLDAIDVGGSVAVVVSALTLTQRHQTLIQRYNFDGTAIHSGSGVVLGRGTPSHQPPFTTAPSVLANGVMMVAFGDFRFSTPIELRIGTFGQAYTPTGDPLWDDSEVPTLVSVIDTPGDQGGHVRVNWTPGIGDLSYTEAVTEYRVWRSAAAAQAARLATLPQAREGERFMFEGRDWMIQSSAFWEMVGSQPAARLPSYALTVVTGQDSMAGTSADQTFMVQAIDDSSHIWWTGVLDGHSVDNLAPPAPSPAAGHNAGGSTTLYWGGTAVADLCCYDIFRGASPGFVPGAGNQVGTTTDVTFTDPGGPAYYRIAARDVHGNVGPSALVIPSGVTGVDDAEPTAWKLTATFAPSGGRLRMALDVPARDDGTLELFDVTGRRVWSAPFRTEGPRSLTFVVDGERAGLPTGVMFVRARSHGGHAMTAKAVVVR